MTDDDVAFGAALMLVRQHGEGAPLKVAERIGELALNGDQDGVRMWRQIASKMDQILRPGPVQ